MSDWLKISKLSRELAVMNIRLTCEDKLQSAIDAVFPAHTWAALSIEEAFEAVKEITTKSANSAILWDRFFLGKQKEEESAKEYIHRCQKEALECGFTCPGCNRDLCDYMLPRKIVSGLGIAKLKQDILENSAQYSTVKAIMAKCEAFEEAVRECSGPKHRGELRVFNEAGIEKSEEFEHLGNEVAAVKTGYRKKKENLPKKPTGAKFWCEFCGMRHLKGRSNCPAGSAKCFHCGKLGHFANCCYNSNPRASGRGTSDNTIGTVGVRGPRGNRDVMASDVMAGDVTSNDVYSDLEVMNIGAASGSKAILNVEISLVDNNRSHIIEAVADTGADVCIAGEIQLKALGISMQCLNKTKMILEHAAGDLMNVLGCCNVVIKCGEMSTKECLYIVKGTRRLFLSLPACRALGLVDPNFPNHTVAGVVGEALPIAIAGGAPEKLPYNPTEDNVPLLKQYLLQRFSGTTFNVSRKPFPVMNGAPHHIHLLPDAVPHAYHTPIPIPKHWEKDVKRQIDEDVAAGILQPVPAGEVAEWCARMVVVGKKDGSPRRTVDYQKLNACCKRETHHQFAPFDMVSSIPIHTFKTTVDAHWGFHQVVLDEESLKLTTFITPWGRYQYCRTPMGHCAAPDAYTKRFDDIIVDIPRKFKCVDDILLHDSSVREAFLHTFDLLLACENNGITLNPEKFEFCQRAVNFVSYNVGWEKYLPSEDKLVAIRGFPMPDQPSISDIRSWFGLVNQLAPFVATAPIMAPFRELLKRGSSKKVYWDENLRFKFEYAKKELCKLVSDGLQYYDKSRPTIVMTDWSKEGMGFVILQQYCSCTNQDVPFCCNGGWKLALCGSRHLSKEELNYAPVEGEAAAVVWCLKKARLFLLGCPNLLLVTDHRPLVRLFGDRELRHIENPRLFRLKEKTLQYKFVVKYVAGKRNTAADTLSRYPSLKATPGDTEIAEAEEIDAMTAGAMIASFSRADSDVIVIDYCDVERAA